MRLEGKVALITGGGTGIGRETAILFAKEGGKVVIAGRKRASLEGTLEKIGGGICFVSDVSIPSEAKKVVTGLIEKYGRIDVLVNNAGTYEPGGLTEANETNWENVFENNVNSVRFCSKEAIPFMKEKGGSIINVASIYGILVLENSPAYVASKAAIIGLTKSMALDYAKYGIRVNCVCPSATETEMLSRLVKGNFQPIAEQHPLGRIGKPIDIAYGLLYLASDESSWVTGAELIIDGGLSLK